MNYIRHLNHVLERFSEDKRIIPRHISMYMALFFLWNKLKFSETIHFVRGELMPLSKIGSLKYYHLTLRELDAWDYIRYQPSKSTFKASGVTILSCFNSDTCSGTSTETSSETTTGSSTATCTETSSAPSTGTSCSTSTGTCSGTTSEAIIINTNKTLLNNINSKETIENNSEHARDAHPQKASEEKTDSDKREADQSKRFQKPTLQALENYFEERDAPQEEAERFFNHFESNGWKVGGKSPMKDWKAAVRNWILNINKYQRNQTEKDQNPLSISNDKDYGEPL